MIMANAYMGKLQKMKPEARTEELSRWKDILEGADKDKAVADLSKEIGEGNFTSKNAHNAAFYSIAELRPVGLSSVPVSALRNRGLEQLAYNLRGWGLYNFNQLKEGVYDNIRSREKDKVHEGIKQLAFLASGMALAGAAGDVVVDWLMGKKVDLPARVQDNLLKLALTSTYQQDKLWGNQPSLKDTMLNLLNTPLLGVLDAAHKNIVEAAQGDKGSFMDLMAKDKTAAQLIPFGVGTFARNRLMGGSREDEAKAVDRKLPDSVQRLSREHAALEKIPEAKRRLNQSTERRYQALSNFDKIKSYYTKKAKDASLAGDYQEGDAAISMLGQVANSPGSWKTRAASIPRKAKAA